MTAPLVEQIVSQVHQLPEDSLIRSVQQEVTAERATTLEKRAERPKEVAPQTTRRAQDLATPGKRFVYVANVTPSKGDGVQPEQEGV